MIPASLVSRLMLILLSLGCSAWASAQATPPVQFEVNYTGALYGYYRIEPVKPVPDLTPVANFLNKYPEGHGQLLLGMGDNFGPVFGASVQLQPAIGQECYLAYSKEGQKLHDMGKYPQALYKSSDRVLGDERVHCDNVAQFLMNAGYRAVVPGREDFLNTATWLRGIALGLRRQSSKGDTTKINNPDGKLTMLAANLRVTGSGTDKASKTAKSQGVGAEDTNTDPSKPKTPKTSGAPACPLLFAAKLEEGSKASKTTCTTGANQTTTAMDWLSRVDASLNSDFISGQISAETLFANAQHSDPKQQISAKERLTTDTSPKMPQAHDPIHEVSVLERRRTLIENQVSVMLSMLDGVDEKDFSANHGAIESIRDALKVLVNDNAYVVNEHTVSPLLDLSQKKPKGLLLNTELPEPSSSGGNRLSGKDALDHICEELKKPICKGPERGNSLNDLCEFGNGLVGKFNLIGTEKSLLVEIPARSAGRRLLLRAIAKEQKEAGYTIASKYESGAAGAQGTRTLIIGIMGQDTMQVVSPGNLKVAKPENEQDKKSLSDEGMDTMSGTVIALEPLRTLLVVLRGAMQLNLDDRSGTTRNSENDQFDRIVVMAQMPRILAEQLSGQLRVSLLKAKKDEKSREEKRQEIVNKAPLNETKALQVIVDSEQDDSIVDVMQVPILVLSEAQIDYFSPKTTVTYTSGTLIPVLTPDPPFDAKGSISRPDSKAEFKFVRQSEQNKDPLEMTMTNGHEIHEPRVPAECQSTQHLLIQSLQALKLQRPASCRALTACSETEDETECKRDLSAELLGALGNGQGSRVRGDVVLLEQRDIYYGNLPGEYSKYEACRELDESMDPKLRGLGLGCHLRVDLDRVLWKGDLTERVMVSGSDLITMLKTSENQELADRSLQPTDISGQSLATFGIAQPASPNLSRPGSGNQEFPLPQDSVCGNARTAVTDPSMYCVNGQPIRSDGAYWVITSDHLANDKLVYKVMAASIPLSYQQLETTYLTGAIADALIGPEYVIPPQSNTKLEAARAEWNQQSRGLVHLDIGKIVAGFSARQPGGGNIYAEQFQGASDSRASTPSQQELDLESLSRVSIDLPMITSPGFFKKQPLTWSVGEQTDAEYDRAATGNLTNKPTAVTYALNSFTVGPFIQARMPQWRGPRGGWPLISGRAIPRTLLVVSPFQYQEQFTGNYLVFPFTQAPPPTTPPTISGQYTTQVPRVTGVFQKAGVRHEYAAPGWFKLDNGSYVEAGPEFGVQNNILSSVSLTSDGLKPLTCSANSSITIPSCFAAYASPKSPNYVKGFQIDSTTSLAAPVATATLHTFGGYWDIHLQKALLKPAATGSASEVSGAKAGINFTLDSKADWFSMRGAGKSLNTQTHYDIPLSMSLNFPVFRNLSLSPTYSAFYFSSQVTGQNIVINSFSIAAKWYFARDSTVPPNRQLYFSGPASADQTSTAKLK
jgi:hypothetical protein